MSEAWALWRRNSNEPTLSNNSRITYSPVLPVQPTFQYIAQQHCSFMLSYIFVACDLLNKIGAKSVCGNMSFQTVPAATYLVIVEKENLDGGGENCILMVQKVTLLLQETFSSFWWLFETRTIILYTLILVVNVFLRNKIQQKIGKKQSNKLLPYL